MGDIDAIVKSAQQRVATSLAGGARKPEDGLLWADVYHPQAAQALAAIGFRELVEALYAARSQMRSPFPMEDIVIAGLGMGLSATEKVDDAIAKLENADG